MKILEKWEWRGSWDWGFPGESQQNPLAPLPLIARGIQPEELCEFEEAVSQLSLPGDRPCVPDSPSGIEGSHRERLKATTVSPDLVTLSQAAAMVHKSKRTLEKYKTRGELPAPEVEGGGGKADLYRWSSIGPWLEKTFGIKQPETFPANGDRP